MHKCNFSISADRAKQIKTKAVVNEDPTEALIRDLMEQNEKLKSQLASGKVDDKELADNFDIENLSKEDLEKVQM